MVWWLAWWEMWMRAAMLPLEIAAASSEPVRTITPETEEYLVRELHEDLELVEKGEWPF